MQGHFKNVTLELPVKHQCKVSELIAECVSDAHQSGLTDWLAVRELINARIAMLPEQARQEFQLILSTMSESNAAAPLSKSLH
jgi:hypothetical protein